MIPWPSQKLFKVGSAPSVTRWQPNVCCWVGTNGLSGVELDFFSNVQNKLPSKATCHRGVRMRRRRCCSDITVTTDWDFCSQEVVDHFNGLKTITPPAQYTSACPVCSDPTDFNTCQFPTSKSDIILNDYPAANVQVLPEGVDPDIYQLWCLTCRSNLVFSTVQSAIQLLFFVKFTLRHPY